MIRSWKIGHLCIFFKYISPAIVVLSKSLKISLCDIEMSLVSGDLGTDAGPAAVSAIHIAPASGHARCIHCSTYSVTMPVHAL